MTRSKTPQELFRLDGVGKTYPRAKSKIAQFFDRTQVQALSDVSFTLRKGTSLGIVGESGSGKTTVARLMVKLLAPSSGSLAYKGNPLQTLTKAQMRDFRNEVQMVFQSTHASLNPRKTIGVTLSESFRPGDASLSMARLLEMARLPANLLDRLPHELSGGQRQRVGIARAIARRPEVIIADEPTSALDVSLQGEVIELLRELHRDVGLTLVVISHDLAMVGELCSSVLVMHGGQVVERGPCAQVLQSPADPYTRRLIDAIPRGPSGTRSSQPVVQAVNSIHETL